MQQQHNRSSVSYRTANLLTPSSLPCRAAFSFTPSLVLTQLRCSGTIDAVQLMAGAYPTRIPHESIYGRYASQMPEFVRKLEPPLFCEALALALEIPSNSFALGRTKIFFKAGKGQVLEELAERDLSEVIPMLIEKVPARHDSNPRD